MNYIVITSKRPNCKTCGCAMAEWSPFMDEHEHDKCYLERIKKEIAIEVREILLRSNVAEN